jgi:branched-chain amino acid transport system permease protein
MQDALQFLFSGLTRGSIYAMIGVGFALIYNCSHVINFAHGEFVMLGGMITVVLALAGVPLAFAALAAVLVAVSVALVLERVAVRSMPTSDPVAVIIVTIGASILIRGIVEGLFGRNFFRMPSFAGEVPIDVLGAKLLPQSVIILFTLVAVSISLKLFFERSVVGKSLIATAENPVAARIVGINTSRVTVLSFGISGMLGALAGLLTAPITLTQYDVGIALGLKGFCAAILGGLSSPFGSIAGGLILGLTEAFAGGYISSAYQDAVAFALIFGVLVLRPQGLFSRRSITRV